MDIRLWREYNFFVLGCVAALLFISILSVYSATLNAMTANGTPLSILFPRHLLNILIGLVGMVLMAALDYRILSGVVVPLYIGTIVLLAVVLIAGKVSSGAQSWVSIGTRTIQPSEVAKLVVILVLASYWSYFEGQRDNWLVQIGSLILTGIPLAFILIQPDLGTALIFGLVWLIMAIGSGAPRSFLITVILLAIPFLFVGWIYVLDDYQRTRLLTFYFLITDPAEVDPNEGYNIIQSLNAISSGGLMGTGLTRGLLSQGNYIPVQYSDFIFAVVGEEMGFFGGVMLILLEGLLLWLTLSVAERARDTFGHLIALGIFALIFVHVMVNIGVTMSILPVTGLPLPFISYGGSFTITMLVAIGLLQSVAMRWRKIVF
jgi:rod shape determining protein RodA